MARKVLVRGAYCAAFSIVFLAGLSASTVAAKSAVPPSVCTRLAAKVHHSPNIIAGSINRLLPRVTFMMFGTSNVDPDDCGTIWKAIRLDMKTQPLPLSCPTKHSGGVFLERLPGTGVYMGGVFKGSGECVHADFVEASHRSSDPLEVRTIAKPQGYTGPCIGRMSGLGEVLGTPSYVESGDVPGGSLAYFIRVTPWTGHKWGSACKVTFHWRFLHRSKVQYCARKSLCQAAKAASAKLARRYIAYQNSRRYVARQNSAFQRRAIISAGHVVPILDQSAMTSRGLTEVARAWKILARQCAPTALPASMCARYPTRKGGEKLYSTFRFFPLKLGTRLYIGGIGHLGAGRAHPPILVSIYAPPRSGQKALSGLAGIWISRCCATGAPSAVITHDEEATRFYRGKRLAGVLFNSRE